MRMFSVENGELLSQLSEMASGIRILSAVALSDGVTN